MKEINIIDHIPIGYKNAISRKELCKRLDMNDREVRKLINKAREEYCICNHSDGAGYYVPEQLSEINAYINQEEARIRSIFRALKGAKIARNLLEKENYYE